VRICKRGKVPRNNLVGWESILEFDCDAFSTGNQMA
jgi:hypothetical protein